MATFIEDLEAREVELDSRLKEMRNDALNLFSQINGESSVHQMHAHIGRNNNVFVNSVTTQFQSPTDFITQWLNGLTKLLEEKREDIAKRRRYNDRKGTLELLPLMLQNSLLKEYIYTFLERNFFRNFRERVRAKPDEALWKIWFGEGKLVWGLLISPAMRMGEWTNDKSQMRRENYHYWTIGHVLTTGLIAPDSSEPVRFKGDLQAFLTFYEAVLARTSNSQYEQAITSNYLEYVRKHPSPHEIPFLIPELRYAGKEEKHRYRLDFCVLNSYTMEMVGFEISPASSHMSISGITTKKQTELNGELKEKWAKEADKRNSYFKKYGITIVTFTDTELQNINACFAEILTKLENRLVSPSTPALAEIALQKVFASI